MKLLLRNIILFFLFGISLSSYAFADIGQALSSGTQWLLSQQNTDGSFGNELEEIPLLTAESIITLQTQPNTDLQVTSAINFLNNYVPTDNDYCSRILSATENNTFLQDILDSYNYDGGWGLSSDLSSEPQTTALVLQALKAVNHPDLNTINSALNYLTSTQNLDGRFGFYAGDDSNVYMTALVLQTLSAYKGIYNIQDSINKATAYILTKQNVDGEVGSSTSTVYETALSLIALIESEQGNALSLQNAINYLLSTQFPNGSWNDDPYSTALALRALANVKPNLSISTNDITFSNPAPTVGDTITITAAVHNTGLAQADNVSVQFYDGDPNAGGVFRNMNIKFFQNLFWINKSFKDCLRTLQGLKR